MGSNQVDILSSTGLPTYTVSELPVCPTNMEVVLAGSADIHNDLTFDPLTCPEQLVLQAPQHSVFGPPDLWVPHPQLQPVLERKCLPRKQSRPAPRDPPPPVIP